MVIAEFCESESICNIVSSLGINMLQGFHLGMHNANLNDEKHELEQVESEV